jgi:hypothetical protein
MAVKVRAKYDWERIWNASRSEYSLNLGDFPTARSLQTRLDEIMIRDKRLGNLRKVKDDFYAYVGTLYQEITPEEKLEPLMALRERGLMSASEFHQLAEEMGLSFNQSERRYRNWSGTESSMFMLKEKNLLRRGEWSQLLRAKRLTKGQGYYRWRKWQAVKGIRPFRNFKPV